MTEIWGSDEQVTPKYGALTSRPARGNQDVGSWRAGRGQDVGSWRV